MSFADIITYLQDRFPVDAYPQAPQPYFTVPADQLVALCQFLRDDERLYIDLLACITAIDNGPEVNTMDVLYNLTSIVYGHTLMLRVTIPRNTGGDSLPTIPSVTAIWRTADWHEREAYDLVGIQFTGHPDMRRILLPTDWPGHPLRRDYQEPEQYHGIKTK